MCISHFLRCSETVSVWRRRVRSPRLTGLTINVLLAVVIIFGAVCSAMAQQDKNKEFWPAVRLNIDLDPRIGLQFYGEKQNGEELPKGELKAGVKVSYRIKRLFKPLVADIDSENKYLVALAAGYEYIQKSKNGQSSHENRLIIEGTPRYAPGAGFLFLSRQRMEFRWINATYNFRYRFKLTGQHNFKVNGFRFTPYMSGELFWDRNHHSWNENQYALGVQLPFRRRLMLDTYVLHQNCTTCSQHSLNAFGISANFYFRRGERK
ncbi:MAG TPA: DUF2490 domain-containing protein [Pyrinomonadaceae bacterium]|nr:DUF2490 domain-containing protein [Pyrinomonadaceae bacterium]